MASFSVSGMDELSAAFGRIENIPWVDRAQEAEKKLSMPKGEDELFAELYTQNGKH